MSAYYSILLKLILIWLKNLVVPIFMSQNDLRIPDPAIYSSYTRGTIVQQRDTTYINEPVCVSDVRDTNKWALNLQSTACLTLSRTTQLAFSESFSTVMEVSVQRNSPNEIIWLVFQRDCMWRWRRPCLKTLSLRVYPHWAASISWDCVYARGVCMA